MNLKIDFKEILKNTISSYLVLNRYDQCYDSLIGFDIKDDEYLYFPFHLQTTLKHFDEIFNQKYSLEEDKGLLNAMTAGNTKCSQEQRISDYLELFSDGWSESVYTLMYNIDEENKQLILSFINHLLSKENVDFSIIREYLRIQKGTNIEKGNLLLRYYNCICNAVKYCPDYFDHDIDFYHYIKIVFFEFEDLLVGLSKSENFEEINLFVDIIHAVEKACDAFIVVFDKEELEKGYTPFWNFLFDESFESSTNITFNFFSFISKRYYTTLDNRYLDLLLELVNDHKRKLSDKYRVSFYWYSENIYEIEDELFVDSMCNILIELYCELINDNIKNAIEIIKKINSKLFGFETFDVLDILDYRDMTEEEEIRSFYLDSIREIAEKKNIDLTQK